MKYVIVIGLCFMFVHLNAQQPPLNNQIQTRWISNKNLRRIAGAEIVAISTLAIIPTFTNFSSQGTEIWIYTFVALECLTVVTSVYMVAKGIANIRSHQAHGAAVNAAPAHVGPVIDILQRPFLPSPAD